jgi:hypothetical protein
MKGIRRKSQITKIIPSFSVRDATNRAKILILHIRYAGIIPTITPSPTGKQIHIKERAKRDANFSTHAQNTIFSDL